ncbi:MAG: nitroreductase family protein [Dehalococcoidia bacterium]
MAGADLYDVMSSMRSVREFSERPVSDDALRQVVEMAIRAPNGSNNQTWRFLVLRDPNVRREVGRLYLESLLQQLDAATADEVLARPGITRTLRDAIHLARRLGEVPPVLIVACIQRSGVSDPGASIFPAVQNLMLAAWGLGLGTVLTTVWQHRGDDMRALLGVPNDVEMAALIPLGYPARPYGPPKRRPLDDVVAHDRWDG